VFGFHCVVLFMLTSGLSNGYAGLRDALSSEDPRFQRFVSTDLCKLSDWKIFTFHSSIHMTTSTRLLAIGFNFTENLL
jgi:hypothetical protein